VQNVAERGDVVPAPEIGRRQIARHK
jgi:hypothetical protein